MSDPAKQDPILDQFSMITRPYTRLNGLKTIPFPVEHTCMANLWEYPPPPHPWGKYANHFYKVDSLEKMQPTYQENLSQLQKKNQQDSKTSSDTFIVLLQSLHIFQCLNSKQTSFIGSNLTYFIINSQLTSQTELYQTKNFSQIENN